MRGAGGKGLNWGRAASEAGCVLLLDDEEIVRHATAGMLDEIGWRLIAVSDGGAAVEAFRNRHREIDIVLVDSILPDEDASSVVASIHAIDASIPVIVMGGEARRGEAALWHGVAGYLVKPFEYRTLSEAMSAALWPESAAASSS